MKRNFSLFFLLIISLIIFVSCQPPVTHDVGNPAYTPTSTPTPTPTPTPINLFPEARTFQALKVTDGTWYAVPAKLMALGNSCAIYVEDAQLAKLSTARAQDIANNFDKNIYTLIQSKFSPASDVDANGKIIILFLDIIDDYNGIGGYVAGYFSGVHCLALPNSNLADMLFMDIDPSTPGERASNITIAHEFQHLVNFNKTYLTGSGNQEDVWINEGLSSAAEYLYNGSHITEKIEYYNLDPYYDLVYGIYFVTWAPSRAQSAYTSYATVYLFFQWLRIQATNGDNIYKDILNSPYCDYHAVQAAANMRLYPGTWSEFFRDWLVANAFNKTTGKYGYKKEIFTVPPYGDYTPFAGTFDIYPGEAVYAYNALSLFNVTPTTYAQYCGLDIINQHVDSVASLAGSNIILAYNSNGEIDGAKVAVSLPVNSTNLVLAPGFNFKNKFDTTPTQPYPVDVQWPVGTSINSGYLPKGKGMEKPQRKLAKVRGLSFFYNTNE